MIEVEYELGRPIVLGQPSRDARSQFLTNLSADTPGLSGTQVEFIASGNTFVARIDLSDPTALSSSTRTALTNALQDNFATTVTHQETRDA